MTAPTDTYRPLRPWLLAMGLALPLTVAVAADFPQGTYLAHKNITITFDEKGAFRVNDEKATVVAGHYSVKGDRLELTDESGPWACTNPGEKSGTYTWTLDGAGLALKKVADTCEPRVGTLATAVWKRP